MLMLTRVPRSALLVLWILSIRSVALLWKKIELLYIFTPNRIHNYPVHFMLFSLNALYVLD